jgi:hypothetical protein
MFKKNSLSKAVLLLSFFCLSVAEGFAQKKELGFGLGASNYTGDVSPEIEFRNFRPAANIFFRLNATNAWSFRFDATIGELSGKDEYFSDPFMQVRKFEFSGSFREISARAEYNFFNFRRSRKRFEKWCPYLFGGIAAVNYSGKNNQIGDYNHTNFSIPFGVGVKHYLSPKWNLGFDFGARKMFADDLDGLLVLKDAPKFKRINDESTDMYFFVGVSISYIFSGIKCPEESR